MYTGSTYSQSILTPIPASRSKKTWCKTIVLVSLTRKEGVRANKGNAWVDYEVVNLSPSACTVSAVTDLERKQVEFDVLLLDSKCYQLLGNKILQERNFGSPHRKCWLHPVNCIKSLLDRWQTASIELTRDDSSDNSDVSFPSSKRAILDCKSQEDIHHKLNAIARGVPVCRSWWPLWATWRMCCVQGHSINPHNGWVLWLHCGMWRVRW